MMNNRLATNLIRGRHHQRGVTLLESLIAMLVLAFGMLSFVALQGKLRQSSDVSKQRSEATRLAQEDLENFRAYGQMTAAADATRTGAIFSYADIAAATAQKTVLATSVVATTNAAYTLTRTVATSAVADFRDVTTTVSWTGRSGDLETVTLRTTVSEMDPALAASLAIAPNGSPVRNALNRDIQVPIPAKNLGDGNSVIKPVSGGSIAYIFNNDSGLVTRRCTSAGGTTTAQITTGTLASAGCTDIANGGAYLVSGFIRFSPDNPSASNLENPNEVVPASGSVAVRMDLNGDVPPSGSFGAAALRLPGAGWPSPMTPIADAVSRMTPAGSYPALPECSSEALQTVIYTTPLSPPITQVNNGVTQTISQTTVVAIIPQTITIADTAASKTAMAPHLGIAAGDAASKILGPRTASPAERYVGYTCLVYPQLVTTPPAFSGRVLLWPTGFVLGTAAGQYKVCRYSADYNLNGYVLLPPAATANVTSIDNAEHPYAYLGAARSFSNQNFLVLKARRTTGGGTPINCPTDGAVEVDGTGGENYTDGTTALHQP